MAFTNRETRMIRAEVLAMVLRVDPAAAEDLEAAVWDGPRWHAKAGRMVLGLTVANADAISRVMNSREAAAALMSRVASASLGAPWTITWDVAAGQPVVPSLPDDPCPVCAAEDDAEALREATAIMVAAWQSEGKP